MVEITSRREFEEWLKNKPDEWAQVLAARSAQRVLPYAFYRGLPIGQPYELALGLMRAYCISWAKSNFDTLDVTSSTHPARMFITRFPSDTFARINAMDSAAVAAAAAAAVQLVGIPQVHQPFYAGAAAASSFDAVRMAGPAPHSGSGARFAALDATAVWKNVSADCEWLVGRTAANSAARELTSVRLWQRDAPIGWDKLSQIFCSSLVSDDQSYQVWIDWYNRRIEGHDASFDIPSDADRKEDKAILTRLAAATDEDFWYKGAVYVNTTLQGWIDEARAQLTRSLEADEPEPQPQNTDVTQFRRNVEGAFEPDFESGSDELLTDQAASDRHFSFISTAIEAQSLCTGHNQIAHIAAHLKVIVDAAGDHPRLMRVDLLIARGEWMIADVADAISEIQSDPEISPATLREKRIVNALNALLRDYTALRTLDPALDRRHRLPDNDADTTNGVSPEQAVVFVNNGVINGAITVASRDVIAEGAARLPENADVSDRKVRRFSELVRNLPRAMIGFLWQHRGAIGGTAIAGVSTVSLTLITNEIAVRSFFANNPGMLSIIDQLVAIIRNVGM